MNQPDLLIFMSDQHAYRNNGFAGHEIVQTPRLDAIAARGTVFEEAYTTCPLCVPARSSMLTGQLPSRTGIFTNAGAIAEEQTTFLHALAAQGYETVLCGRMHFVGKDQRHGFTRRIMGDITALHWGVGAGRSGELGAFAGTLGETGCHKVVGGGNSPVLEYDRAVIAAALDYLAQPHERPQCILVGTYAPHFPYVAPAQLYSGYKAVADLPQTRLCAADPCPATAYKEQPEEDAKVRAMRAAYYGMITHLDGQIGAVHDAWKAYLERTGREGVFVYLSDHGDQIGERALYGKKTFFEGAAHIPLIFEGDGVPGGACIGGAVSIMDLGPTLCAIAAAEPPPAQDGASLWPLLRAGAADSTRAVLCELIDEGQARPAPARMAVQDGFKLIHYAGYEQGDLLFNLRADPYELHNAAQSYPDKLKSLRDFLLQDWDEETLVRRYEEARAHHALLARFGKLHGADESELWKIPPACAAEPEVQ